MEKDKALDLYLDGKKMRLQNMKARVIAFYLPQYHPTPENDMYWGKGFTEWTNVVKARPLFRGHYQPQLPADLGFYDLRLPQVREEQARLAKEAGIEGFCYWRYWFGNGRKTLDMPFNEVLKSGKPDYPFCLGWANHDWTTKTWEAQRRHTSTTMIFEQLYPGQEDYTNHFFDVLPAFKDKRYMTVDGKPIFLVFNPQLVPDMAYFIELWNKLARENGLEGVYFISRYSALPDITTRNYKEIENMADQRYKEMFSEGFDAINSITLKYAEFKAKNIIHKAVAATLRKKFDIVEKYRYADIMNNIIMPQDYVEGVYPTIIPRWDRSPRAGKKAIVYYDSTPELFKDSVKKAIKCVENRKPDHRIIFLNAWNEWGEGAYMEPDLRFGHGYLDAIKEALED